MIHKVYLNEFNPKSKHKTQNCPIECHVPLTVPHILLSRK